MRIAVLGDIHANLPALEAVLADVSRQTCDLVLHTGGLVGFGASPNEVIDLVRARGIVGVRGHFDEAVAWAGPAAPGSTASGDTWSGPGSNGSLDWNARHIGFTQRVFLKGLPFSLQRRAGDRTVAVFHASPTDFYQGIEETATESWLAKLAEETGADVQLFGHTHRPFHREVGGRHFVNAGSVGRPRDGDPRACVAIVELNRAVSVEFRRIAYDVEKAAREMEAAGRGADVARELRMGM